MALCGGTGLAHGRLEAATASLRIRRGHRILALAERERLPRDRPARADGAPPRAGAPRPGRALSHPREAGGARGAHAALPACAARRRGGRAVVRVNPVATYVAEHHERLGLERFGIARRPPCVLLTPRFKRSRHVIALVLAEERQGPALVGKLPRRATDAAGLAREAENLRAVRRALSDASVPTVLAFEDDRPHPLLLETGLEGVPLSPAALRRNRRGAAEAVAGWLERL